MASARHGQRNPAALITPQSGYGRLLQADLQDRIVAVIDDGGEGDLQLPCQFFLGAAFALADQPQLIG